MKTPLRSDLFPTYCLDVDSADARELAWLPYAVRFKLDECGLRMSLRERQKLSIGQRTALVHAPLLPGTGGFRPLALAVGAKPNAVSRRAAADNPKHWLMSATPFGLYVAAKLVRRQALD